MWIKTHLLAPLYLFVVVVVVVDSFLAIRFKLLLQQLQRDFGLAVRRAIRVVRTAWADRAAIAHLLNRTIRYSQDNDDSNENGIICAHLQTRAQHLRQLIDVQILVLGRHFAQCRRHNAEVAAQFADDGRDPFGGRQDFHALGVRIVADAERTLDAIGVHSKYIVIWTTSWLFWDSLFCCQTSERWML